MTAILSFGPQMNQAFPLSESCQIGTSSTSQLRFEIEGLAPQHARIEKKGERYLLRDFRSGLETKINGVVIQEAFLNDGDFIQMGPIEVQFQLKEVDRKSCRLKSKNQIWQEQLDRLPSIAASDFSVLLLGPSGAGKEILARQVHELSNRSEGPFVSVNCSALTENLIESELFGHIKGSFTGAINDRKGAFEAARGGTLFLDEIGDLPMALQAKLLRALENNEIRPVGSDKCLQTDVRIVAATHSALAERIARKEFRADLYFRLNVVQVNPPALIDRLEDFDDLIYGFCKQFRVRFSFDAIQKMKTHRWTGNIRELRNAVARASVLFPQKQVQTENVDQLVDFSETPQSFSTERLGIAESDLPLLEEIERQMIIKRLTANHGNQRKTAKDLGLPKSTLHDRLRDYRINPKDFC